MTEIFYAESGIILQEMRKGLIERKNETVYGEEIIEEIFRGVHTLKADSAMMLYEYMADVSRKLESLLYCFRGGNNQVENTVRFDAIIISYLDFFEQETDKLAEGIFPNSKATSLERLIDEYTEEMKAHMSEADMNEYQAQIEKKAKNAKQRQIFYIPSAAEPNSEISVITEPMDSNVESTDTSTESVSGEDASTDTISEQEQNVSKSLSSEEDVQNSTIDTEEFHKVEEERNTENDTSDGSDSKHDTKSKKQYILNEEERELFFKSSRNLERLINWFEYSTDSEGNGTFQKDQLDKLKEINQELSIVKKTLTKTDFVAVAKKLEVVVDEMARSLHKAVKLTVKGETIPVDLDVREKISSALIHMIRNAVDHGIEDMDMRDYYGKSPMGLIKLKFVMDNGHLKITVKDDGAGIDKKKILEKAKEKGLLTKPEDEYDDNEIFNDIMLRSGLTTTEEPNEFSGRGVGMDVISHNVKELGGRLKIRSEEGLGTTITMKF